MFYLTFDWYHWDQARSWTYLCYEEGRVSHRWPDSRAWTPGRLLRYQVDGCSGDALTFFFRNVTVSNLGLDTTVIAFFFSWLLASGS
jgi:hypothetical protein